MRKLSTPNLQPSGTDTTVTDATFASWDGYKKARFPRGDLKMFDSLRYFAADLLTSHIGASLIIVYLTECCEVQLEILRFASSSFMSVSYSLSCVKHLGNYNLTGCRDIETRSATSGHIAVLI